MADLRRPAICLVTDRRRLPSPQHDNLVRLAASAAAAGVDLIHLRERDLDDRSLLALARDVVRAAAGARVVVNDRADIAIAAGAAGVHLRADSVPASRLRAWVPEPFLIGRSIHSAEEAGRVEGGLDYLVLGTVYPTASKPGRTGVVGLEALREACRATRLPVLAIGGITADRVTDIAAAGAAGFAAIGLFADLAGADRGDNLHGLASLVADARRDFAARASLPG